jgi:hypothetical protein
MHCPREGEFFLIFQVFGRGLYLFFPVTASSAYYRCITCVESMLDMLTITQIIVPEVSLLSEVRVRLTSTTHSRSV